MSNDDARRRDVIRRAGYLHQDPESRRAYLDAWSGDRDVSPDADGDLISRIGHAERLVERCAQDWQEAQRDAQQYRAWGAPVELMPGRHLSPQQRHEFLAGQAAEQAVTGCERAYYAARADLDRLLAQFDTWQPGYETYRRDDRL